MTFPPLPLPPLARAVIAPPVQSTDELLNQMTSVLYYGELHEPTWQARRRGCKDYGAKSETARGAMLNALKV